MPADFSTGAHAPLHQMTIHPDGTLDTSRLEPDITGYIDLGGHGARDVAARRP